MPRTWLSDPILLHLFELLKEVVKPKGRLAHLALHLLGLAFVDNLLGPLDQRQHVAHSKNSRGHAVGMERLERLDGLAGADELDRNPGDGAH